VESARAAQAALDAGQLPTDDPLLAEIDRRIQISLAGAESPQGERRERAMEKLRLLRGEVLEPGSREKKLKRTSEVLQFADVLHPEELSEVRSLRDALVLEGTPSTLADFQAAFHLPSERIEFPSNRQRATLHFEFGAATAGSFAPASWTPDGRGWIAPRNARTDKEMLADAGPTLLLRDPLKIQSEIFEIQLEFEQPPDSPPDLLLVSVAGFQIVLTGGRNARCLVETGDPALAVLHARAAEGGKSFEGLDRGGRYVLRLVLNRAAGRAQVEGEWKRLLEILPVAPRGDEKNLALTVRSFESVRLISATIEAARR
jgi:hypothetical protein